MNLVGKLLLWVHFESGGFMKLLSKVKIQDLRWTKESKSFRKHTKQFKNIKTSLKSDPFDKSSMINILYVASKCLKRTFENKSHEVRSVKFGPDMYYLSNTVQWLWYFVSKFLLWTFRKSQMKSAPSNMLLAWSIS